MKMTASNNIKNGTFKQISRHVNRTFFNKKYGTMNDKNLSHINPKFSYLNLSSDGSYREINGQLVFVYNKQKERLNRKNIANKVNSTYRKYIKNHNNKKSVKHNKSRQIHNLFKDKLLKKLPKNQRNLDNRTYLDKYERLLIQNCGNSKENLKNIKLIQKYQTRNHRHLSFQKANKLYRKSVSIALSFYAQQFSKFNSHLLLINYSTNSDECANKSKGTPDALHVHTSIIGLTHTKSGKPSFSVGRAMCQQEHVPYNYAITRIHGEKVNNSIHTAMKKFRIRNGEIFLKSFLQPTLSIVFPKVQQFRDINYYQTGQKINGLDMNSERLRQSAKSLANQLENKLNSKETKLNRKHKRQSYLNRVNGAKRSRSKRKYNQQRRYINRRMKALKIAHKQLKRERSVDIHKWKETLLKRENLSLKIKSQQRTIKNNDKKINNQKSKLNNIQSIIKNKENELKIFANNLIQAFQKTIKQNNQANNRNLKEIQNANSRLEKDKLKQAHKGIFGKIKSTLSNFSSNYSSSANQSSFSNLSNTFNSISSASSYSSALPSLRAFKRAKAKQNTKEMKKETLNSNNQEMAYKPAQPTISTPNNNERGWERN